MITDISRRYENERPRRECSKDPKREPPYGEIVIPQRAERWAAGLSKLSGSLAPDQEMDSVFSNEIYEDSKKEPPCAPFVAPKLQGKPWIVPLHSHDRAAKCRSDSVARKSRGPSHQASMRAWILYRLMFSTTGDICNAWRDLGGIAFQFSPP